MNIYTIGFTKTSAEHFFGLLRQSGTKTVIDVRRNNSSQLAGFAKKADLEFFLRELGNIAYVHMPELAPTQEMIDDYRKGDRSWDRFAARYLDRIRSAQIENHLDQALFDNSCLLCSEHEAEHCHRHVLAEYLATHWGPINIVHLQ